MLKLQIQNVNKLSFVNGGNQCAPAERVRKINAFRKAITHLRSVSKSIGDALQGCGYSPRNLDYDIEDMRSLLKTQRNALRGANTSKVYTLTWERGGERTTATHTAGPNESGLPILSHLLNDVRTSIRRKRLDRRTVPSYRKRFNRHYTFQAVGVDDYGRGGVHREGGDVIRALVAKKAVRLTEQKYPSTDARYVGVELEFCSDSDETAVKAALSAAGLADWLTLKSDGSVRPEDGDHAYEINVLAKESEYKAVIERTCAVLNSLKGYVNESCGFHAHIDMRTRDVATAFNNLVASQTILYKMVPSSRKKNTYCKPTRGRDWNNSRRGSRYRGVNRLAYREHKTIEVRIHSGTLNAAKVNNWVALLILIADAPSVTGRMPSISGWARHIGMSSELKAYVAGRIAAFAQARPADAAAESAADNAATNPAAVAERVRARASRSVDMVPECGAEECETCPRVPRTSLESVA